MMLSKCVAVRVLLSPNFLKRFIVCSSYSTFQSIIPATQPAEAFGDYNSKFVALSFKEWFQSSNDDVLDRIFEILGTKVYDDDDDDLASREVSELALTRLGLKLSEEFVLKVLNHGKDVFACLKFFDWAGTQHGYSHTRATFNAIFKILSRAKLYPMMLDFLDTYTTQRHMHKVRFYDTLVMGYAFVGKPYIALQLLGKMRFQGLDLDAFAYHVLLNALVEEKCYDIVEAISKQITLRGLDNEITACIRVKNLCKQNRLEEAEAFIRGLERDGGAVDDYAVSVIVDSLCKRHKFEVAGRLVEDFQELKKFPMPHTYGIWIRNLVQAAKLDGALEFLRSKRLLEGYLPDVFRYNILISKLLRENRLHEVYDLLIEMREGKISPDKVTMNASLCFFCKAGMIDVAVELYNSRSEFGLSLNSLAYNFLINTLCGDGSVDEAYRVLRDSIAQGYFPGKKTFSILADALCREGRLDMMKELILIALEQHVMPSDAVCVKFISGLCRARRVEDGYLILGELNRYGKVTNRYTYFDLIRGFNRSNRGDMASRLLIDMQENGHTPTRNLYRAVIGSLCTMDDPENQFFKLLQMQLTRHKPIPQVYSFFIDGAGHAKRPDLARKVFEMMPIKPNLSTQILLLQSYLKSDRIADALNFFNDLCKEAKPGRKLFNTMIVGLSKANKPDLALELLRKVRDEGLVPSLECYEELVRSFCVVQNYDMVVEVIDDLEKSGRQVSSFIGNILLLHSLTDRKLYLAWTRSAAANGEEFSPSCSILGNLVRLFSFRPDVDLHLENLDEAIEQCFPLDIFTYNMLMRRLAKAQRMDYASELFDKIREKGYQPNRWTYDIIVHGLCKHGRREEARRWIDEMYRKGFDLTDSTKQLV